MSHQQRQLRLAPGLPEVPPGEDELLTEDGEPMESMRHREQAHLLLDSLLHHWRDRHDFFAGANMFLYFSETQVRKNDFRGPDFFVVLDTVWKERKAWVCWMEDGKRPNFVLELLSETTEQEDRGSKMRIYEKVLGVPEYFLFDPWTGQLEGYRITGSAYQPVPPDDRGRLTSTELGLQLGTWSGEYNRIFATWLRWYTPDGELVPTPAEAEARRAEAEASQRSQAEAKAAELAQRVAELEQELRRRG